MNAILMIFTLLVVIFGLNFYIFFRLWHLIPVFPAGRVILVGVAVFLVVSPFISLGLGSRFPFSVSSCMYRVGTSWLIIMLYLGALFFVLDIVRITGLLPLNRFMCNSWMGFGILSLLVVALMTAGNVHYHNKKRVELTIKTDKNVASERPLKVVAMGDLHLGYGIGVKEFRKWVKLINQEEPDIVLIAGDLIDNSVKPLYDRDFANIFGKIKTKYGIYMAPGNHEYISNITESIDFLTKAGVTVLRDSVVLVDNTYYVAGRDDRSNSQRKTIAQLTALLDTSKPVILIDHQPYHFDEVEKNNIDVYIAGHTHEGQVWPASLIVKAMYEISHGYLKKGNTHFYVTSGIGIWGGKFRIGSRSEYVVMYIE
ncbi:MAG: metallophosphoesterase [Bacteroidales bacterium]|nr:metallophosphoesterase [Bacteroidales bacterium]